MERGHEDRGSVDRSAVGRRGSGTGSRVARACIWRDRGTGPRGGGGDPPRRGARGDAGGAKGWGIADRTRRIAWWVRGRAGAAAPGGAAARARGGRSSAAQRGAGGARPRADRGERGRGSDHVRG